QKEEGNMVQSILLCGILADIVFGVQLTLCCRAKKAVLRRIPVFVIAALYAAAAVLYSSDALHGGGGVAIGAIFAFILLVVDTVALTADLLAWLMYRHLQKQSGRLGSR
ncbi:MAG: hypothetical protein IJ484_07030, partial [Oscillospiraceae bacterium]|nr:hypothetical protein [Oscillospiraceae bacterium]